MDNPPLHRIDESNLFRASCETSLWDFLKTDIGKGKCIECHFPFNNNDACLSLDLVRRGVDWIKFANTDKLYPPDFKPSYIALRSVVELNRALLEKPLAKHFYCKFEQNKLTYQHKRSLNQTHVASVSFSDGHTLYAPF
ncbi:hypothetical protein OPW33_17475 [Vibrio europaeus]|uniref:hypothetical protein n=1 Tax=Vibrio europaeus TaxID=300876 RepID=UPI002341A048|nr:hypothetical protein [Vibrio europaeus]MDC5841116.1 hypothetical protein [Vibrio europaeus]